MVWKDEGGSANAPQQSSTKDDKYSPTFKIKINNIDRVDCYDIDKNRMSIMDLAKGSKGKVNECSSVWFVEITLGSFTSTANGRPTGADCGFRFRMIR